MDLSYSQPTLILGDDEDVLSILIHTKYLDGTPVLIFASQNDSKLMTSQQLNNIKNYVFVDEDLKKEERFIGSLLIKSINEPHAELSYIFKTRAGSFFLPFTSVSAYFLKISVVPSTVDQPNETEEFSKNPLKNDIIRIDNSVFSINDFANDLKRGENNSNILEKVLRLRPGEHHYEFLKNSFFNIQWIIFEPQTQYQSSEAEERRPSVTFRRINPTKYLINVRGTNGPFWLVFSETYHPAWKVYRASPEDLQDAGRPHVATMYKNIGVKEIKAETQFTPKDIKYLFSNPLPIQHFQVNDYANGWYVDPKKLGAVTNFDLVLNFYPQSLFYLGFFITLMTLFMCCFWQGYVFFRNIFKDHKNAKI